MPKNNNLSPGEVLEKIPGLRRDKLNYWAKSGYLEIVREQIGNRDFTFYPKSSLPTIKAAYKLIVEGGMKDKVAFKRIDEKRSPQPTV
ncbi:MAG: hypothetical protein GY864_01885 [Desulfobacterales bacterium]|nr:hypothetical protein [Desulfobacterales bacterium]